jgi:hypothetical protein
MNKLLKTASAVSLALSILTGMASPASAQQAPPAKHDIIEYCRATIANSPPLDNPQLGDCVGFWNSYPHALPAQVCKFYREIGLITNEQFADCVAYLKGLGL